MNEPATVAIPKNGIPSRVEAAQQFLQFAANKSLSGNLYSLPGDCPREQGELTPKERAVYDAALDVLNSYFRGEMDFGDNPPISSPPDDRPQSPVYVPS